MRYGFAVTTFKITNDPILIIRVYWDVWTLNDVTTFINSLN